ncbi:MAG: response regulator [Planctomycetes bacterium]|nr:response regulator [Planctomycetota bacterium]
MGNSDATEQLTILIAEDDDGHAKLIEMHLREAGLANPFVRFRDGQEVLDFLFRRGDGMQRRTGQSYLLLLDIRMPKVDGVEVLRQLKADAELHKLPVIVLTTSDDPRAVEACYALGCNCFVTKPVEFAAFAETLRRVGLFVLVIAAPRINGEPSHPLSN